MIRETLNANSTYAFSFFTTNTGYFRSRATTGGSMTQQTLGFTSAATPYWIKIARSGNSFTAFVSINGFEWLQIGSASTVTMGSNVYVGLAVASGSGVLETATFDNVSVGSS